MDAFRMSTEFTTLTSLGIKRGNLARINNGRGARLRVELGSVWITQDGDTKDVFLRTGESFQIERDGLTLVSVLGDTTFAMVAIDPSTASA